ncbi:Imm1 family immunity protein [Plantactinospora sp. WMMC1484]|uniref:Imm1 family immunity protein n=1 Tax=Plantactinospora sp. WMMC1484 TaxID=3404122 RepID=UPI003BF5FEC1
MTVAVVWGQGRWRAVDGVVELDGLLAGLAVSPVGPQVVGLYPPAFLEPGFRPCGSPSSLQLGLGHPVRGFLYWTGPAGGIGFEPEVPPWPTGVHEIEFDYGGDPIACGPEVAGVSPDAVRDAALEYAVTGARPRRVLWRDC